MLTNLLAHSVPAALRARLVAGEETLIDENTDPAGDSLQDAEEYVPENVQALVTDAGMIWGILIGIGLSAALALAVTMVSSMVMKQIFRRVTEVKRAINRTRTLLFMAITLIGTRLTSGFVAGDEWWYPPVAFAMVVAIVVALSWWALRLVRVAEAFVLSKYAGDGDLEDRRGRRLQTQVSLIRRILAAVIVTLAVAAVLLTIEQVRALGVGMLASAGVVSVVAGLAMQSTLTNVFAGLQLAFTDSIRVGDVVIVEENFGTVEDITLSTVVLKGWEGKRFVYPSSYFVATPFENWTRVGTEMMGTVDLEVDWRVPMDELRGRLKRLLESTDLWDGRECSMQVTDASGGMVQCRAVVSARNSGELWDLRCLVREDFVNFLRAEHPYAVLTQRMLISHEEALLGGGDAVQTGQFGAVEEGASAAEQPPTTAGMSPEEQEFIRRYGSAAEPAGGAASDAGVGTDETPLASAGEGASIFTGSISAVERNREFSGPGQEVYRERLERQAEQDGELEDEGPDQERPARG